jgi:hypothetical protein
MDLKSLLRTEVEIGLVTTIAVAAATMAEQTAPQAPTAATDGENRLSNTTICLPLVHGSVAWFLGPGKNDFQTHQWTLYLRGANNEDLSACIDKVVFQLHPSFAQPIRVFSVCPYEVTEKGWGEFEAQITIHWKDPTEKTTIVRVDIVCFETLICQLAR